jgi:hypothetical protein
VKIIFNEYGNKPFVLNRHYTEVKRKNTISHLALAGIRFIAGVRVKLHAFLTLKLDGDDLHTEPA